MMGFSKFKNGLSGFVLLFCLLVGMILASSQSAMAAPEKSIGSAENSGIKLTINNFTITNYGQEMIMYYTVESNKGNLIDENGKGLLKSPELSIGDNRVQAVDVGHKKISNQEYQGTLRVNLPQYRPALSDAALNTDAILNQQGQWTINFEIKK